MKRLLRTLALGSRQDGQDGMTLEISVHSPSDTQHFFRDFRIDDDYPVHSGDDLSIRNIGDLAIFHARKQFFQWSLRPLDMVPHHCLDITGRPPQGAVQRCLGTPLDFLSRLSGVLPRVPIVSEFLMRRQHYRQLSPIALARLFSESLVCAESLRLERWCRPTPEEEAEFLNGTNMEFELKCPLSRPSADNIQGLRDHMLPSLPRTLNKFFYFATIFPRFHEIYTPQDLMVHPSFSATEFLQQFGHLFTELSFSHPCETEPLKLQQTISPEETPLMSISLKTRPWDMLEKLALKSRILSRHSTQDQIDLLLKGAASVAEAMPKLRLMEIWNHGSESDYRPKIGGRRADDACVFRYRLVSHQARISWHSTWSAAPTLSSKVTRAWDKVASAHTHRPVIARILPSAAAWLPGTGCFYLYLISTDVVVPFTAKLMFYDYRICFQ